MQLISRRKKKKKIYEQYSKHTVYLNRLLCLVFPFCFVFTLLIFFFFNHCLLTLNAVFVSGVPYSG